MTGKRKIPVLHPASRFAIVTLAASGFQAAVATSSRFVVGESRGRRRVLAVHELVAIENLLQPTTGIRRLYRLAEGQFDSVLS